MESVDAACTAGHEQAMISYWRASKTQHIATVHGATALHPQTKLQEIKLSEAFRHAIAA